MKKLVSVLLVFTLLITSSFSVFAYDQNDEGLRVYDDVIKDYVTIKMVESNELEYRSQAIDSNNNVVYDFTYDVEGNYLYDNITKQKTDLGDDFIKSRNALSTKKISTFKSLSSSDPNYCTYPDPVEFGIPLKLVANAGMISAAALTTALAPLIAASLGVTVGVVHTIIAATMITTVMGDIWGVVTSGGDLGRNLTFKASYTCEHMCTWDDGEVCFYGDTVDGLEYLGLD